MSYLSPTQQAALRAAAQTQANPSGETDAQIGTGIESSLQSSGQFTPEQLAQMSAGWTGDMTDPSGVWGKGPGEVDAWASQFGGYLNNPGTSGGATIASSVLDPAQIAKTQPLPFSSFGNIPYVAPSTYNASGYTPTGYTAPSVSSEGAYLDPKQNQSFLDQNMGLLKTSMDPTFKEQQQQQDQGLAARGILNSGASIQANNDLAEKQAAALAGAQVPLVSQGYGYEQSDLQNNATFNQNRNFADAGAQATAGAFNANAANASGAFGAGAENTAGQFNAGSTNATNEYDANNYLGVTSGDQTAYNAWLAAQGSNGANYGQNLLGYYLGTFNPQGNSGVVSTFGQGANNATNVGSTAYNASLANSGGVGSALGEVGTQLFGGPKRASAPNFGLAAGVSEAGV